MAIENGIERVGTRELWEQFDRSPLEVYQRVAVEMEDVGISDAPTMTRALEYAQPSGEHDELDAYERMLQQSGIRTQSDPVGGFWASPATDFLRSAGTRALLSEFYVRNWRKVSYGKQDRAVLLSSDSNIGSWERPYADAMMPRWSQRVAPAIPLPELVSMTTPIDNDVYRALYLTYDAAQLRAFRVGESADIPIATIVSSEHTIRLHKYGRGLRASYEELRRMRVDKLAYYIMMMAVQAEIDKVAAAMAVIINGDGNANTAATSYNLTTLDTGATAGTLTANGWLAFRMKFAQPYIMTTALMNENIALQLALLNMGSANVPLVTIPTLSGFGTQLRAINQTGDAVGFGWTSEAPANKIVGFDGRTTLERVTEIGSEISETERFITNQTQIITFTEVEGYATLDANGAKILNVAG